MKQNWMKLALAAALATGLTVAQTATPQPGERQGEKRRGPRGGMLERMASHLNLTEAQREQAKAAFQDAREQSQPVMEQLRTTRQELADAVKSGKTEVEIDMIARRQGELMGQLAGIQSKAMAKVYATLTPEQREKANELRERFQGMPHRFGKRG
jgi:Spy/CpxP family protein refolding chaperone